MKIIFGCSESMNKYEEEFEFENDIPEPMIEEMFQEWVWDQIADNFYFRIEKVGDRE